MMSVNCCQAVCFDVMLAIFEENIGRCGYIT